MATVDPFRPHEVITRQVISSSDSVITAELVTIKMLDDGSLAYGCRAWSSVQSRITSLYDNEAEARAEVKSFLIAVPNEATR